MPLLREREVFPDGPGPGLIQEPVMSKPALRGLARPCGVRAAYLPHGAQLAGLRGTGRGRGQSVASLQRHCWLPGGTEG